MNVAISKFNKTLSQCPLKNEDETDRDNMEYGCVSFTILYNS